MWHGWVGQRIAESTKGAFRLSLVIFFLAGCVLLAGSLGLVDLYGGWGLAAAMAFLVALLNFITSKKQAGAYDQHPFCRAIAEFGPLESLVPQIDAEVMEGFSNLGSSVIATKSWLISFGGRAIMRKADVVWVYPKKETVRVNFARVGTTYSAVIHDSRGGVLRGGKGEQEVTGILNGLLESMPWVIAGYTTDLEKLYANDRAAFTTAVAERRSKSKNAAGAAQ